MTTLSSNYIKIGIHEVWSWILHRKAIKKIGFNEIGTGVLISKNCTFIKVENISIGHNVRIDGNVTFAVSSGFIDW